MDFLMILMFGISICPALLLIKILDRNKENKQKKKQRGKEEEDQIFVTNALIIMAKVMAADRTNMVCELDIIKQFIKRYDEAHFKERVKFVKEYALKFKNYNETALSDFDNLIETINKVSNFTRKNGFLNICLRLPFQTDHVVPRKSYF